MEFHYFSLYLLALFPVISLFGYTLLIKDVARYSFGSSLFLSICYIVVINYIFGISEYLALGQTLTFWLGIVLFLWHGLVKSKVARFFNIYSLLYALPFIIIFTAIPDNWIFFGWDEMSHWAPSIKYISMKDRIYKDYGLIPFSSYPPAQQIFQYWFLKSSFLGWNEKFILYANDLFILSGLLSISQSKLINRKLSLYFFYITIFIIQWGSEYGFDFAHIFADALLGILFACSLFFACFQGKRVVDVTSLSVVLIVLTLQKQTGLLLAMIVLTYLIVKSLFAYRTAEISNKFSILLTPTLCIFAVASSFTSWAHYSKPSSIENPIGFTNYSNFFNIIDWIASPKNITFGMEVWANFLGKIKSPFLKTSLFSHYVSIFDISIFFSLAIILCLVPLYFNRNLSPLKIKLIQILILTYLAFFVYIAYLLFVFIFLFVPYEGLKLASFERYVFTFLIAPFLIVSALFINYASSLRSTVKTLYLSLFFLTCIIFVPLSTLKNISTKLEIDPNAMLLQKEELDLISHIPLSPNKQNKVYFIHQNSQGYEKYTFQYLALPNEVPSSWWSIGKPYTENDIWTGDVDLHRLVEGYDYLVINNADERFWRDYGKYFAEADINSKKGVFIIQKTEHTPFFLKIN